MGKRMKWLEALLFPPICRACGARMTIFAPVLPQVLCPDCATRWRALAEMPCRTCGEAMPRCLCAPNVLRENGCERLVKLTRYRAGGHDVSERLILRCKDVNDRALFSHLAAELMLPTFRALQASGVGLESVIVTYAPRRASVVRTVGHDQAGQLARALAKGLGVPCVRTLRRIRDGAQQKELSADERRHHAAESYAACPSNAWQGKTVVLVDDICTTGASLAACARLLRESGAEGVIAVCVAVTEAS
jgi:ComF family protein